MHKDRLLQAEDLVWLNKIQSESQGIVQSVSQGRVLGEPSRVLMRLNRTQL